MRKVKGARRRSDCATKRKHSNITRLFSIFGDFLGFIFKNRT